jgi:hypothetical protein
MAGSVLVRVGLEAELGHVRSQITGYVFPEAASDSDNLPGTNIPAEAEVIFNNFGDPHDDGFGRKCRSDSLFTGKPGVSLRWPDRHPPDTSEVLTTREVR